MLRVIISFIAVIFLLQGIALADYYKWEDEDGVLHITDYPPPEASPAQNIQVHKNQSEENRDSVGSAKDRKTSPSPDPSATQPAGSGKQTPAPYNCIKICLEDSRSARSKCREDRDEYRSCMKNNHEQLKTCRQNCKEEEKASRTAGNINTDSSKKRAAANAPSFEINLIDKRDPAEREGYPYPKSWFSYKMHGDLSLNVDRLAILRSKLGEHFGSRLEGRTIILMKFSTIETTVRPSFTKDSTGKQVPYNGPFLPTLIAEITLTIDDHPCAGSSMLQLRQGSRSTTSALSLATTMVVDDLIKNMKRGEEFWNR